MTTRWPTRRSVTADPTSTMSPPPSWPNTHGMCGTSRLPSNTDRSEPQRPTPRIWTITSSGPHSGSGQSSTICTCPGEVRVTALICAHQGLRLERCPTWRFSSVSMRQHSATISAAETPRRRGSSPRSLSSSADRVPPDHAPARSEEHTSELQSHHDLVCRLLLEKKKKKKKKKKKQKKKKTKKNTKKKKKLT